MPQLATQLPARRPGLVSSPAGDDGRYLVRNRATGESFQLGEEEHFLLERLDGRQTADEICRDFADRFGEPLAEDELEEFVELSAERGLLQVGRIGNPSYRLADDASMSQLTTTHHSPLTTHQLIDPGPLEKTTGTPPRAASRPAWRARWTVRLLKAASAVLRWLVWLPNFAGRNIQEKLRQFEFVPRPDDVFLVTYPRSGTTWMQMVLYQLTTDGGMDFPHIAEYCPWFERSLKAATAFETRPSPRIFKSHLPYRKVPKGPCKYIYVARNGKDVAVSYYHLNRTYNSYEGDFARFFDLFLAGKTPFGCWLEHVQEWWAHRDDPNVLFLTYEELKRDLEGSIRRIAAFIGRDVPPERLPGIVQRCGFDFMKQYEDKFDPAMESLWEQGVKLKSFLRRGRVGDGAVCLTDEQQARFDETFGSRLRELGVPLS
jgi:Sulfotransferase domain/Coenzyme PQQ synthesis protein D (PqqD)